MVLIFQEEHVGSWWCVEARCSHEPRSPGLCPPHSRGCQADCILGQTKKPKMLQKLPSLLYWYILKNQTVFLKMCFKNMHGDAQICWQDTLHCTPLKIWVFRLCSTNKFYYYYYWSEMQLFLCSRLELYSVLSSFRLGTTFKAKL